MNHIRPNESSIDNKAVRRYAVLVLLAMLILMRIGLSSRLPAYIISHNIHDDAWCATRAMYILNGQWMGPYDQYTLIKGVFAPLLMAFSQIAGLTYMEMCTLLYCISCVLFLAALSPAIKSWVLRGIIFTVLLFNPVSYALDTFQRVYRNGLSQWQLLLVFGGVIGLFLRRNESAKKLFPWSIMTGTAIWAFFNTREDGIWLVPFLLVASALTAIFSFLEGGKKVRGKLAIFVLPLVLLGAGNMIISMINQSVYGAALRNDRDNGYYASVVKDLYLITPDPEDDALYSSEQYQGQYYNIYTSTMEKAYEASPTLASIRETIDTAIKMWDNVAGIAGDGQPYADHILFALRDGVAAGGYYKNLPETEEFYRQVHEELQSAFQSGTLEKRGISLTAMAAPLQERDLPEIFAQIPKTIQFVTSFQDVAAAALPSVGGDEAVYKIAALTGDQGILGEKGYYTISGWSFLFSNDAQMTGAVYGEDGTMLGMLSFMDGTDVYEYYKSMGMDYEAAKQCRFAVSIPERTTSEGMTLRIWDAGDTENFMQCDLEEALFAEDGMSGGAGFENGHINIDQAKFQSGSASIQIAGYAPMVDRANWVTGIYRAASPALCILALVAYVYLGIQLLRTRKAMDQGLLAVVLLLTGVLLSFLVFVSAMSYMTATTFSAELYLYLSSAYIMLLIFVSVSCCATLSTILRKYTR